MKVSVSKERLVTLEKSVSVMQHAQKQECNEVTRFWFGGRLSPVLDMYLVASSGLRGVYKVQNWEGQRQKWRRIKVSRIVCFCAHSHEVLRVHPISARGSKTARLYGMLLKARYTSNAEPEFAGYRITCLCMCRRFEVFLALDLADASYAVRTHISGKTLTSW